MGEEVKVPETKTGDEVKVPSQDSKYTPEEIAAHNLKKKAEDAKALGLDPKKIILGEDSKEEVPEWYKKEKSKEATQTALQMAESITDADTKEKVITYLQTRIVPSGNPEQDFKDALGAVSSSKNKQVIEEIGRYTRPKTVATGGSTPASLEEEFVPTEEEKSFMQPPWNLTKEKILANRRK